MHWTGLNFQEIAVYEIPSYQIYIIWDNNTKNYTANQWKHVFTHEHGHGIGYSGHNLDNSSLMYPELRTPKLAPTANDKAHMRNVYIIN